MQIEDGTGGGYKTMVNSENRLAVTSVSSSVEHHTNHHDGAAYQVIIDQAATAIDDCIFYMINTSETDITLEGIHLSVDAAAEVYLQKGAVGTRNAATALTPANCNFGSGRTAEGTWEQGADLDGGAATLTGGIEIERYVFRAATNTSHFNFPQDYIMPKGSTLTIWVSSTATVNATLHFNYHPVALG
jgi:hypothetical protein